MIITKFSYFYNMYYLQYKIALMKSIFLLTSWINIHKQYFMFWQQNKQYYEAMRHDILCSYFDIF